MDVPAKFRAALIAALNDALPALIESAWARSHDKAAAPTPSLPQREARTKRRRLEKGRMRLAVIELIAANDTKGGLTRSEIRGLLPHQLSVDSEISESTLKRTLLELRALEQIETRNSRWHLAPPAYLKGKR